MKDKTNRKKHSAVGDGAYVNMVAQLGTSRDKAAGGQFNYPIRLNDIELESAYTQDWIAKRIIERPAEDMLRAGWYYQNATDSQISALNDELKRLKLIPRLLSLLASARLYGTSYLLLGVADGLKTSEPLDRSRIRNRNLQFITALSKKHVTPSDQKLPPEQTAGELNLPVYYNVNLNDGKSSFQVHHSRIIRLDHLSLVTTALTTQYEIGVSVLQTVYDVVLRYASVNANAASLVHEAKVDVIKTSGLVDKIKSDLKGVMDRFGAMALLKGINGMLVMDKGEEEYESKSYSFGGLPELMREFSVQTSGAAEMPYTVLFGQSPSGMNSTGEHDTRNYYDSIATKQTWQLKPVLMDVLDVITRSLFNQPVSNLDIVFNPLWQLDPKTRAEIEKSNSDRDKNYLEVGVVNEAQIARQLVQDGTYTVIDDAHIKMLESMVGQVDGNA